MNKSSIKSISIGVRKGVILVFLISLATSSSSCSAYASVPVSDPSQDISSPQTIPMQITEPTPTPAPTASPTPNPTPTPTPSPSPSPTPAPTPQPASDIDWYDGYADPRTIIPTVVTNPDDVDVLVNKYYSIPEDYLPELVEAESSSGETIRPELAGSWNKMRADCEAATGYTLYLCDGYRTFDEQAALFERSTARNGIAYCCSNNALEGRSEHNLGLAIDISTTDVGEISSGFAETNAGAWVAEHCFEYGFVMRYPKDKTMITGYAYEPWHYRFLGTELAAELYANNLSLEEYYGAIPELLPD
jgi:D-alanyl-D-alanine carboxypeptidase